MSLAETAVLAVELKLAGATAYKTGISEAEAATAGLNRTVASSKNVLGGTTSNLGLFRQAAISTGTALGGMASHLKGVITGPLGMLGLGAGLFTVAGALKGSIGKADEFSLAIEKLQGLTGDSADSLSQLIAVTDNYGISADRLTRLVGFTEKALGNLATAGKTADFAKQFGFSVTDAAGKVLPFNDILLKAADFYNSNADQSTKAALAAKLFGRSYADLVPILKLGSRGITEAEQAAKDLGITLNTTNVKDLAAYRAATRSLGDAVSGLQLQIGLSLAPTFTQLANGITSFLATGGTAKIVTGFKSMLESAKELGAVITGTVIPTIQGLAGTAKGFWDSIPAPLRDLIFKGVVADRTIHFLFGVSPISLGKSLIGDVLGPIIGHFADRGSSPANPVFVSGVGLGGLPGIIPGAAAVAGGSVIATVALSALTIAAIGLAFVSAMQQIPDIVPLDQGGTPGQGFSRGHGFGPRSGHGQEMPAAVLADERPRGTANDPIHTSSTDQQPGKALDDMTSALKTYLRMLNASQKLTPAQAEAIRAADRLARHAPGIGPFKKSDITPRLSFLAASHPGKQDLAVAGALVLGFETGEGGAAFRSTKDLKRTIEALRTDQKTLGPKDAAIIGGYLERLKVVLADRLQKAKDDIARAQKAAGIQVAAAVKNKDSNITIPITSTVVIDGRTYVANLTRYTSVVGGRIQNATGVSGV